jgi:hypothetical protein
MTCGGLLRADLQPRHALERGVRLSAQSLSRVVKKLMNIAWQGRLHEFSWITGVLAQRCSLAGEVYWLTGS